METEDVPKQFKTNPNILNLREYKQTVKLSCIRSFVLELQQIPTDFVKNLLCVKIPVFP